MAATINYVLGVNTSQAQRQVQNLHNNAQSLFSRGINVVLNNRFSGPLGKITGDVKQFDKSLDAATARVIAFTSTTSILYSVGAAMKRLVGDAIAVEAALAKIQAISFSSSSSMKLFGDELFKIANKTSQSFTDVAAAAEEFSRQGLSTAETLKAVSAASVLAKLSGTSLASSIEGLVGIMQTFSAQALEYKDVVSLLTSVDAQFATSAAGLVEGLKRVSSVASDAGLTLQDTAAAIASVRQLTGRSEAVIGNGLKTIITNFRTEAVGKQLESIGVYTKDAQGNFRDLTSVIGEVQEAFSKLGSQAVEDISLKIAGKFQINNLKALLKAFKDVGNGEGSLFEKAQKSANPDDNLTQKRVDILTNTTESKLKKLDNDFTKLGANLGTNLLKPAFDKTVDFISDITGLFNRFEGVAGPVLKGISDVLSGPALLIGATVLGTLFFKLTREVGGVLAGLLNINRADTAILSTQQLINDALVAADRTIVDQIRNATTLEAKYEAINRLVAQFIAQQNRNGGYSQGLYSTGSTVRTSGGGNGGGGGGAGGGGGMNYYGGAGNGGFTRYAPGSIVTPVNGQLPTTRTVNGNSIPAPITNPNVLYAGSTGRNGTAQLPFRTRTGQDIRPELINVPGQQTGNRALLLASLGVPLVTGALSTAFTKKDPNGIEQETTRSKFVSDIGGSVGTGLTTSFLASSFGLGAAALPLGIAAGGLSAVNAVGKVKSNSLSEEIKSLNFQSEKNSKSSQSLADYFNVSQELSDAQKAGEPAYKIRNIQSKRSSLRANLDTATLARIDSAPNEKEKERIRAEEETKARKREEAISLAATLTDKAKANYDNYSVFKRSENQQSFTSLRGLTQETIPGLFKHYRAGLGFKTKYDYNAAERADISGSFAAFGKGIDKNDLIGKNGLETGLGKTANFINKYGTSGEESIKGLKKGLIDSGYDPKAVDAIFGKLDGADAKTVKTSIQSFVQSLIDTLEQARKNIPNEKDKDARDKATRRQLEKRNSDIEKSYDINATNNALNSRKREFLLNANKSILDSRNQNGQVSAEEYNSLNLINESKSISAETAKSISESSEDFRKEFGVALDESIKDFSTTAQDYIKKAFQENGASNRTLQVASTEYFAKNGNNEEGVRKFLKPFEDILSAKSRSIDSIRNSGNQSLLESSFKYQQQEEQNRFIRRKERESALSPFGDTLVNNLIATNQDINLGARSKTGEFLKNTLLQKTTSQLLNKPEYSFSDTEKRFDLSRREAQTKRETLASIEAAKNNLSFLPLGANATDRDRRLQNIQKSEARNNLESLFKKSGNIDIRERAFGGLGKTFQELQQFQKQNPSSYTFGNIGLQQGIQEKILNQDFAGASSLLAPELKAAQSKEFQDKFKGTDYGENIKRFLENLNNIIERGKKETELNPEIAKVEAEKIISRNAGDRTDPNNKPAASLEDILQRITSVAETYAKGTKQEVDAKVEMIVGVNFDPSKVFNNDSFKSSISEIVSSTVKSYLEANNTTGTPPVTPP